MGFTSFDGLWNGLAGRGAGRRVGAWVLMSALSLVGTTGCGVQEVSFAEQGPGLQAQEQALAMDNGLSLNGLSLNGLSLNGLSLNGLSLNGLSTTDFSNWFNSDPAGHEQLMRYIVLCAVPEGESRSFRNPTTGVLYTWSGWMGLAPSWSSGAPATVVEQQIVSACLAAHANNYGVHVPISLLGSSASGVAIPISSNELSLYAVRESCFFGNVFNGEGFFAGNDRNSLADDQSTSRPCGLAGYGALTNAACPQMKRIGQCEQYCTLDSSSTSYTRCTINGVQYKPITTRIRAEDLHRCGDGLCQQGESCGWGTAANNCQLDCGTCAP